MKHLVATTALALILSAPAMAQTIEEQNQAAQDQVTQQQAGQEQALAGNGFVQRLEAGDILAGELIGQDVFAMRADAQDVPQTATTPQEEPAAQPDDQQQLDDQQMQDEQAMQPDDQQLQDEQVAAQDRQQIAGDMRTMDRAQLEQMDNIGQVTEVVLDQEGQVKAIVVGVGGFLGIGEHEVALEFERVSFAADQDDPAHYYLIVDTTAEQLEAAPEFERAVMRDEARIDEQARVEDEPATEEELALADERQQVEEERADEWRADRDPFAAPQVEREGFARAEATEVSVDNLIGANVYDVQDENIGSVNDVVISQAGEPGFIVVDIGGFLGIGTHTVALGLDEVTILHDDGWDDLRVYIEATQEQLEGMPEYAEAN